MKKFLNLFLCLFVLVGCTKKYLQKYEPIDLENKTITVPKGSYGLKGEIKQVLSDNGWELAIDKAPSKIKGSLGEKTDIEVYDKFKTKYRLHIASAKMDVCIFPLSSIFEPFVSYDISVVNNKTGMEVLSMSGKDCEDRVVDNFMEQINM